MITWGDSATMTSGPPFAGRRPDYAMIWRAFSLAQRRRALQWFPPFGGCQGKHPSRDRLRPCPGLCQSAEQGERPQSSRSITAPSITLKRVAGGVSSAYPLNVFFPPTLKSYVTLPPLAPGGWQNSSLTTGPGPAAPGSLPNMNGHGRALQVRRAVSDFGRHRVWRDLPVDPLGRACDLCLEV